MDNILAGAHGMPARAACVRPASAAWRHCSTLEVPPRERFAFFRALPFGSSIECPLGAAGADFLADFRYLTTDDGVGFAEMDIDPCVSRFGLGGNERTITVGLLLAGSLRVERGRDPALQLNAGAGPLLFDATRPMVIRSSRCRIAYLHLRRDDVVAAIGGEPVPRGAAVRPFASGTLSARLRASMVSIPSCTSQDAAAAGAALATAQALALVALAKLHGPGHRWPENLRAALYRAACHELALHTADPRVTVDAVAATLGCSRAQLYRLFAAHGESVAAHLARLRMRRAAELLRARPQLAIGLVAARCGYGEPAAFDKAFRHHFGMTPRDLRTAARDRGVDARSRGRCARVAGAIETFGLTRLALPFQ